MRKSRPQLSLIQAVDRNDHPSEAALMVSGDSDDTVVAVQPDESDPVRPFLSRQRSWNARTCPCFGPRYRLNGNQLVGYAIGT
ncbi:hypothetical protein [Streptomyces sp. NPDC088115]|uniref:hypothetical protein n=1 Tax=Streptomyces sp. NPDC088115 TaxID=3365824 RepID=UPI003806ED50